MTSRKKQILTQLAAGIAALALFWWAGSQLFAAPSNQAAATEDVKLDISDLPVDLYLFAGSQFDQIQFPATNTVTATMPVQANLKIGNTLAKALAVTPGTTSTILTFLNTDINSSGYISSWKLSTDDTNSVSVNLGVDIPSRDYLVRVDGIEWSYIQADAAQYLNFTYSLDPGQHTFTIERRDRPGVPLWFIQMMDDQRKKGAGTETAQEELQPGVLSEELGVGVDNGTSQKIRTICQNEADAIKTAEVQKQMENSLITRILNNIFDKFKQLTGQSTASITSFIAEGTASTHRLGAGERAGLIYSFRSVFGRIPESAADWSDVICSGSGVYPLQRDLAKEKDAIGIFGRIYQRSPDFSKLGDNTAIKIFTYGVRPVARDLRKERASIDTFITVFKRLPNSAADWDIIRGIAYSGAAR